METQGRIKRRRVEYETDTYEYVMPLSRYNIHGPVVITGPDTEDWWVESVNDQMHLVNVETGVAKLAANIMTPCTMYTHRDGPFRMRVTTSTAAIDTQHYPTEFDLFVNPQRLTELMVAGWAIPGEDFLLREFYNTMNRQHMHMRYRSITPANTEYSVYSSVPTGHFTPPLPYNWKVALFPAQLASLQWMLAYEDKIRRRDVKVADGTKLSLGSSGYCLTAGTAMVMRDDCCENPLLTARGGILANATGSGKTALAIALVACGASEEPWSDVEAGRMYRPQMMTTLRSRATLIIVPVNLPHQWFREFAKFHPGCTVLKLTNKREHTQMTYSDILSADCIVTTMSFLCGGYYKTVLTEILGRNHVMSGEFPRIARDLLAKETTSCVSSPILQLIWWRRIIYDEVHEVLVTSTAQCRVWDWTIKQLCANVRWGFTGTPTILSEYCQQMYIELIYGTTRITPALLDNTLRQSYHRNEITVPLTPLHVHEHMVNLTPEERALLNSYAAQQPEQIVQIATHYSVLDPQFSRETDAGVEIRLLSLAEIQNLVQHGRQSEINKMKKRLIDMQQEVATTVAALTVVEADLQHNPGAPNRVRTVAQLRTTQTSLTDKISVLQQQLTSACREYTFFERQLLGEEEKKEGGAHEEKKEGGATLEDCPICLTEPTTVITRCGHWFCRGCAQRMVEAQHKCAMCKRKLTLGDVLELNTTEKEKEGEGVITLHEEVLGVEEQNPGYGTKMGKIIHTIQQVVAQGEKTVLFVQWSRLMRSMKAVFMTAGIRIASMDGNSNTRAAALNRLRSGDIDVLMVSLENGASGLTLTEANHVMFAHALVSHSAAERQATYVQALGRVHRMGQEKEVNVHWFIADATLESQLFNRFIGQ